MRGDNLLRAFAHESEIHRRHAAGSVDRMQCSEKRCLWSLLVHCTASNNNFPKSGLVDQSSFKWRGRPLRRINLLHVVHKIKTNRLGRAIVHHCEDTRLSFGWDLRDLRKARLAQHVHHQPAAFLHPTILGGNRRLANPGLQTLDVFIMLLLNLRDDRLKVRILTLCNGWKSGACGGHCGSGNEFSSVHEARG